LGAGGVDLAGLGSKPLRRCPTSHGFDVVKIVTEGPSRWRRLPHAAHFPSEA
jgi:hypothetical protein